MTYKHNVPYHQNVTTEQQMLIVNGSKLGVLLDNVKDCWEKLQTHAWTWGCTCHEDSNGVHILKACVEGRMLHDEYKAALFKLRKYNED